jgi:hypothetical protein
VSWRDVVFSPRHRFALGVEEGGDRYYLSIPVSNGLVDYEERYAITRESFERYRRDLESALPMVRACRARTLDHLLLEPAGTPRGEPS